MRLFWTEDATQLLVMTRKQAWAPENNAWTETPQIQNQAGDKQNQQKSSAEKKEKREKRKERKERKMVEGKREA